MLAAEREYLFDRGDALAGKARSFFMIRGAEPGACIEPA
jgi:hypothetical protein